MTQYHLVLDFPIRGAANAKALNDELPPLMPDFAKVQDELGTVHFSRFMVEGDEKLLFVSDIDGDATQHIERLVESAAPVLDTVFEHVKDPPATPVTDNRAEVVKWLVAHVREPLDMYFAYGDASVQDIKACAREAGFTGSTLAESIADVHDHQVSSAAHSSDIRHERYHGQGSCRVGCHRDLTCRPFCLL